MVLPCPELTSWRPLQKQRLFTFEPATQLLRNMKAAYPPSSCLHQVMPVLTERMELNNANARKSIQERLAKNVPGGTPDLSMELVSNAIATERQRIVIQRRGFAVDAMEIQWVL